MTVTRNLPLLLAADLDGLIADLKQKGTSDLILVGPRVHYLNGAYPWLDEWNHTSVAYKLQEAVADLAQRLSVLTRLTFLDLRSNHIDDAGAASLKSLTQLSSLNLSHNQIGDTGVASLSALKQLKSLNVSHNQISAAGAESLETFTQITTLDLSLNSIRDAGVAYLKPLIQLTFLNLANNQIGDEGAASLEGLSHLRSLNLENNQISAVGLVFLKSLTQLCSLSLNSNEVGDAGAAYLAELNRSNLISSLDSLGLAGNGISDEGAASLATLTLLSSLNLGNNMIGDAGVASLVSLANLSSLTLECNKITDIRPLAVLRNLKSLVLKRETPLSLMGDETPLLYPSPEIVNQGQESVLNYLREASVQGVDHIYEAKVMILGEGGAGKTSLLRRLYCPDLGLPEEEDSTKGIDILSYEYSNSEGKPFRLNVWDFGGQEIYHHTHRFFLTKRSLYILVDDTRNSCKTVYDHGFKYWLEVIELLSEGCPVIIFQNQKSSRSKSIDEAGIKGRFPNVIDVYRGNLNEPQAAKSLEEAIRLKVQQLPHVGDEVPKQWVVIRQELEKIKQEQPYITQDEYFQLYERYLPKDKTKALLLSRYFHDIGVILHFQDDPLLSRTVILQNNWATEAVYRVLDDEPTKDKFGYFSREDCQRIWAFSTYADMHPELLALMENFELCYKLSDRPKETWLLPQLLSPSTPEALRNWGQPDDLVLTYQYDFLPKGLINRLMVRMHRYVHQPECSWRSGVCFAQGPTELLARVSSCSGQEIELRARGPERKTLMDVIASDLDALNDSFEGLKGKVRKFVPCLCSECRHSTTPERYQEANLLKRKQDGKLTIECRVSYEEVSVLELLEGFKLDVPPPWAKPAQDESPDANAHPSASPFGIQQSVAQVRYAATSATGSASIQIINHNYSAGLPPAAPSPGSERSRTIKIFLASSAELKQDRDAFELHFRQANDRWLPKGIYLQILRWETCLDAMSETRQQDEYNNKVRDCDIFLSLFMTKTGKFTEEEFDMAHATFMAKKKPLIYTYFKDAQISLGSITEEINTLLSFKKRLSDLGHYHTHYTSIEDLKLRFQGQLDQLIDAGQV